jgi:hypothetical protein
VNSQDLQNIDKFNPTIRDNMNVRYLIDPCRRSIIDPHLEIVDGTYDVHLGSCKFKDYGIPLRLGLLKEDDSIDDELRLMRFDAGLSTTGPWTTVRFLDRIGGKRRLINIEAEVVLQSEKNNDIGNIIRRIYVNAPENIGFGERSHLHLVVDSRISMYGGKCTGSWPTYHCFWDRYLAGIANGIPVAGSRSVPNAFLWNWEDWDAAETSIAKGASPYSETFERGLTILNEYFTNRDVYRACGMIFTKHVAGMLRFESNDDYRRHKAILT